MKNQYRQVSMKTKVVLHLNDIHLYLKPETF